jgi:hypothetical protein
MKFPFYADPGHGWIKVPKTLLKKLGIEKNISSYSYMRKENVYLEEDCDLAKFLHAMKRIGSTVTFNESHTNRSSKIRNYMSYG